MNILEWNKLQTIARHISEMYKPYETFYFLQKGDWKAEFRFPKGTESLYLLLTPNCSGSPTIVNFSSKGTVQLPEHAVDQFPPLRAHAIVFSLQL